MMKLLVYNVWKEIKDVLFICDIWTFDCDARGNICINWSIDADGIKPSRQLR